MVTNLFDRSSKGLESKLSPCMENTHIIFPPPLNFLNTLHGPGWKPLTSRTEHNCHPQTFPQNFLFSHAPAELEKIKQTPFNTFP